MKMLKKSAETYPTSNQKYVRGNLYLYEGLVYVCKVSGSWGYDKQYNSKGNPKENYSAAFPKLTQEKLQNARTFADAKPKGDGTYNLDPVSLVIFIEMMKTNTIFMLDLKMIQ